MWKSADARAFAATAHDGYEFAWVHRAGLHYTVDGTCVALQPGQVMLVPPGASHASRFDAGMHASSVHVDTTLVAGLATALGTCPPQRARVLHNAAHIAQLGDLLVRETATAGR